MGWHDHHLYRFRFRQGRNSVTIGLPEAGDRSVLPGWEIGILEYFVAIGDSALYEYDFGDSWIHEVLLEDIMSAAERVRYPRCVEGRGACPPEDCGGIGGYAELVHILKNPKHREYPSRVAWLKSHAKNYWPVDAERFDIRDVYFSDPRKRFRIAFGNSGK